MKSILVLVGGADSDDLVFETARAAAVPFAGHLNFLHIYVEAGQAALNSPHTEFASGPSLSNALQELEARWKEEGRLIGELRTMREKLETNAVASQPGSEKKAGKLSAAEVGE